MKLLRKAVLFFGVLAMALLHTGCISYSGKGLPRVESFPRPEVRPSVDVAYSFQTFSNGKEFNATDFFRERYQKMMINRFEASGLFSSVRSADANSDLLVTVAVTHRGSGSLFLAKLCGATLGLIPCRAEDEYRVSASVFDRMTKSTSAVEVVDSQVLWIHCFLIPAMPFFDNDKTVERDIVNNLMDTLALGVYDRFVREHPNMEEYALQAKQRIENIHHEERMRCFAEAKDTGTVESLEAYLKRYPDGPESDELRKQLKVLREWEPRKCLGELITSLSPVMVVRSSGSGMNITGTASGEYINFGGQGATLEPQAKEQDVIPKISQLLKAGVDPNALRIRGFEPASRKPLGGGAEKVSSGSPGEVVPTDKGGMTLLEYCSTNKFTEVAELLKAHGAK